MQQTSIFLTNSGELFDYIVARKRLNEKEAQRVFRQVTWEEGYMGVFFVLIVSVLVCVGE